MTALEWIQQYENYLALAKNRSVNTVRSYIRDAELLSTRRRWGGNPQLDATPG